MAIFWGCPWAAALFPWEVCTPIHRTGLPDAMFMVFNPRSWLTGRGELCSQS